MVFKRRPSTKKPRTTVPGDPSERIPCLVDLKRSRKWSGFGANRSLPIFHTERAFPTWSAVVVICSPGMFSLRNLSNSLDMEFLLARPWNCSYRWAKSPTDASTPIRGSFTSGDSWQGSKEQRRSRSAGLVGATAYEQTFLGGETMEDSQNMRRCKLRAYSEAEAEKAACPISGMEYLP